jgi:hypothetical protein
MKVQRVTTALIGAVIGAILVLVSGTIGIQRASAEPGSMPHPRFVGCDDHRPGEQADLPCVFDARHMGDGTGRSFVVYRLKPGNDHPVGRYITHRKAHALLYSEGGQGSQAPCHGVKGCGGQGPQTPCSKPGGCGGHR